MASSSASPSQTSRLHTSASPLPTLSLPTLSLPLSPSSSASPSPSLSPDTHPPPGHHQTSHHRRPIPSDPDNPMSSNSKRPSRSRPRSTPFPPLHSSLSYALVRDFAYPTFHPMHFGASPEDPSGPTTPPAEWNTSRRMSDSAEGSAASGRATFAAGPWGGDGHIYNDPHHTDVEPLPSTSFASGDDWDDDETSFRKSKHRKSRSFADIPNYERGRRRESGTRASRDSDASQHHDPAGRDALRQSRGQAEDGDLAPSGRRDSHFAGTLPSRSFHTSQPVDPDEDIPLDAEPSTHSPQRESLGPEDEEYAGPSLALYSFEPENDNELRLAEGQTVLVAYRHGQGWLVAENPQTGEQGLIPEQYVRLLRDIEGWDEERGGFIDDDDEDSSPDAESLTIDEKALEANASAQVSHLPTDPTAKAPQPDENKVPGTSMSNSAAAYGDDYDLDAQNSNA